ncbi:MAG: FAD:protein FMN transferase [Candidatus Omnitrophica bacterium]|nr:FAD:protein FMN transferase [Candidatus Omnitrophota bacterium]
MNGLLRYSHRAMATLFEAVFPEGEQGAQSVAETLFEEIDRIENLLSRFDPTSEVSRINREASKEAVRIDSELFDLLEVCRDYWEKSDGAFDPAGCLPGSPTRFGQIELNERERTIRFDHPELILDFGAVGKGYALLRCQKTFREMGIGNALIHGGTSSVLAIGPGPSGQGWPVGLRHSEDETKINLLDQSLSTSAVHSPDKERSDILDPRRRENLTEHLACTVIGENSLTVEILSTAFLVMGREMAEKYVKENGSEGVCEIWGKVSGAN